MKKIAVAVPLIKKIMGFVYNLIIGVIVLAAGLIVLSTMDTPIKMRLFAVLSGSMEPNISVGSLVVVFPQSSYQVGDVITVRGEKNPKETVTHRIINIRQANGVSGPVYELKGDANEEKDREAIPSNRVVGKVFVHVPYIGRIISFAQTQQGFIAMIVVPATILLYSEAMAMKNEVVRLITGKKTVPVAEEKKVPVTKKVTKKKKQNPPVFSKLFHSSPQQSVKHISIFEEHISIRRPVAIPKNSPLVLSENPRLTIPQMAEQKIHHVLHIEGRSDNIVISV